MISSIFSLAGYSEIIGLTATYANRAGGKLDF